jgi:peptide/nickel transport system substrate-binding protein
MPRDSKETTEAPDDRDEQGPGLLDRELSRREVFGAAAIGAGALAGILPNIAFARHLSRMAKSDVTNINWAIALQPPSIDVASNFATDMMTASYQIAETLMTVDRSLKLQPLLASSMKVVNATTYVYNLRPNVKFHNGATMTPEDVIYSFERSVLPTSKVQIYFQTIHRIKKTGPNQVTFHLKAPDPFFQYTALFAPIIPKAFAKPLGATLGAPGLNWVGTGPFVLTKYDSTGIVATRNDKYWGQKPAAAQMTFPYISDTQALLLAFQSGQIDGTYTAPLSQIQAWAAVPNARNYLPLPLQFAMLSFDQETAPWQDIHLRRAMRFAFNGKDIVRAVFKGRATVAQTMVPPAAWGNVLDPAGVAKLNASLPQYPFDLTKAKAELAKSSVPNGLSVTLPVPNSLPDQATALQAYAADLKTIGINLSINVQPAAQWRAYRAAHVNLGLQTTRSSPDYADPADYMSLLAISAAATVNGANVANFKNPSFDAALANYKKSVTQADKVKYITLMLKITQAYLPYMPLWFQGPIISLGPNLDERGITAMFYAQPWSQLLKPRT